MSDVIKKHELPIGWDWYTLNDVTTVGAGNPAPQGDYKFENGNMPFVQVRDMGKLEGQIRLQKVGDYVNEIGAVGLKVFKKGSILFTKSGASTLLNQRAILGQDSFVVSHIAVAEPKNDVLSEWVYYWMKLIDFGKLAHGANMPSLPLSKAKLIPIPLAPPEQQKQIVAKIEQLFSHIDAGIEALNTAKQRLKQYRQSVLKAAVTGELSKEWREAQQNAIGCAEARSASIPQTQDALPIVSTSYLVFLWGNMTQYRRFYTLGASWFFTVNLAQRRNNHLLVEQVDLLREAFRYVKKRDPYRMDAVVIMPDHLHCIWALPQDDADYPLRWRLLKAYFSRGIPKGERISNSRSKRRERGIWQRRFWAHLLTDQDDYNRHFDYIHWNPVKHGVVHQVNEWPHSSFHRSVERGIYPFDWGHSGEFFIDIDD